MKIATFIIALAVVVCSADVPKLSGGPTTIPIPPPPESDPASGPASDPPSEPDSETAAKPSSSKPLILPRPPILPHPPILPPVLPPPRNNCSGICTKIYSPVCGGPVYGCGELVQQSNVCEFNYFNCVNLIKTGVPYEVKYKGPCYAPIAMP